MTSRLTVVDLQLVEAVARHGSVGAAAKELLIAQPSASRRLLALERRLSTKLFDRDTTGARATPAGRELARHAARLLSDLDALPDQVLAAVDTPTLAVGTIQALSPMVFTALEIELDSVSVRPEIDHGPV
ncbi:LysR family transcriptional regulator, partial [Micromonospora andamanensis]